MLLKLHCDVYYCFNFITFISYLRDNEKDTNKIMSTRQAEVSKSITLLCKVMEIVAELRSESECTVFEVSFFMCFVV